jgi:hypothetical protein
MTKYIHDSNNIKIQSARFLPATASNKKKRQTSSNTFVENKILLTFFFLFSSTYTCDQATGLYGDLFTAQYIMQYPRTCITLSCRQKYFNGIQAAIRTKNYYRYEIYC